MNKTELITAVARRLGTDQETAAAAVDGVLGIVMRAVGDGESVSLSGFGVFEARERPSRAGRNPRTGEVITLAARTVPVFRPGLRFRRALGGAPEPTGPTRPSGPVAGVRVIIESTPASENQARPSGKAKTAGKAAKKAKDATRGVKAGKAATPRSGTAQKRGKKGGKK
ncbi:HU family DNA-binding protein [Pseudonocardia eucalypti]|uniref:HU family DNA-binding protein n=1 Tax=Pseudonocardia eucalypti TaxID=648755 RepID=A0ABP9QTF3_9PSEU|nr:DNA-binding protein HU-beta [Pseudonocardia eucalypti]